MYTYSNSIQEAGGARALCTSESSPRTRLLLAACCLHPARPLPATPPPPHRLQGGAPTRSTQCLLSRPPPPPAAVAQWGGLTFAAKDRAARVFADAEAVQFWARGGAGGDGPAGDLVVRLGDIMGVSWRGGWVGLRRVRQAL